MTEVVLKQYYTTYEASDRLMVTHSTVIEWIKAGKLKATKTLGGHRRIPKRELEKFIKRNNMDLSRSTNRILVVDDDESIRQGLKELFEKEKFTVDLACDGFEAGVMAISNEPSIMILDLKMRGLDGFSACRLIRTNPHLKDIKILVLTGYPSKENIKKALDYGANKCLAKPVDGDELFRAVKSLLKTKTG